jgi:seryl-tRNA synthetase
MLDIKLIRENPELIKKVVKDKKINVDVDQLLQLDEERRRLLTDVENLNQEKNLAAKDKDIDRGKLVKENLVALEARFSELDAAYREVMQKMPNFYSDDTPVGKDESENVVLRKVGKIPEFGFKPREHWELGKDLGIIDNETAAEVSGARFTYLKGDLALMQFALIQFVLGILTNEKTVAKIIKDNKLSISHKPFSPVVPPVMIKPEVMQRMGRLEPRDERYHMQADDLYLVGSAEHTMGPMHMGQAIPENQLPIRYIGYSTAFRREAGSYGKDMKGILRLHQFDKLEMEIFSTPETGMQEHLLTVGVQEYIWQELGIPYQVIIACTGDMGDPDFRHIDIEAWLPGQDKYREVTTSDYMTDWQSRRLNTKVKRQEGKPELVHMTDATAVAIGRTLIAIMENYQREDGSIEIPKALQPFMFGKTEIKK